MNSFVLVCIALLFICNFIQCYPLHSFQDDVHLEFFNITSTRGKLSQLIHDVQEPRKVYALFDHSDEVATTVFEFDLSKGSILTEFNNNEPLSSRFSFSSIITFRWLNQTNRYCIVNKSIITCIGMVSTLHSNSWYHYASWISLQVGGANSDATVGSFNLQTQSWKTYLLGFTYATTALEGRFLYFAVVANRTETSPGYGIVVRKMDIETKETPLNIYFVRTGADSQCVLSVANGHVILFYRDLNDGIVAHVLDTDLNQKHRNVMRGNQKLIGDASKMTSNVANTFYFLTRVSMDKSYTIVRLVVSATGDTSLSSKVQLVDPMKVWEAYRCDNRGIQFHCYSVIGTLFSSWSFSWFSEGAPTDYFADGYTIFHGEETEVELYPTIVVLPENNTYISAIGSAVTLFKYNMEAEAVDILVSDVKDSNKEIGTITSGQSSGDSAYLGTDNGQLIRLDSFEARIQRICGNNGELATIVTDHYLSEHLYFACVDYVDKKTEFVKYSTVDFSVVNTVETDLFLPQFALIRNNTAYFTGVKELLYTVEFGEISVVKEHHHLDCFAGAARFIDIGSLILIVGNYICDLNLIEPSKSGDILKFYVEGSPLYSYYISATKELFLATKQGKGNESYVLISRTEELGKTDRLRLKRVPGTFKSSIEYGQYCSLWFTARDEEPDKTLVFLTAPMSEPEYLMTIDFETEIELALNSQGSKLVLVGSNGKAATATVSAYCNTTVPSNIDTDTKKQNKTGIKLISVMVPIFSVALLVFVTCIFIVVFVVVLRRYLQLKKSFSLHSLMSQDYELISREPKPPTMDNVIIKFNKLRFSTRISEGAAGIVYKGKWNNMEVAIKKLKVEDPDSFIREVSVLNSLRHPYIINFYGLCYDEDNNYIITEFVAKGSLSQFIYQSTKPSKFRVKLRILSEIAKGMTYLHQLVPPIMHRDLKAANILLNENLRVKICDFGVSKSASTRTMTGTAYGTLEYMAPEILEGSLQYTEKCDIYSYGILMYELFLSTHPYTLLSETDDHVDLFNPLAIGNKIINGFRPYIPFNYQNPQQSDHLKCIQYFKKNNAEKKLSDELIVALVSAYFTLCERCWSSHAASRPSFEEIDEEIQHILDRL